MIKSQLATSGFLVSQVNKFERALGGVYSSPPDTKKGGLLRLKNRFR